MTLNPMDEYMRLLEEAKARNPYDLRARLDDSAHVALGRIVFLAAFLDMNGHWIVGIMPDGRIAAECVV